MHAHVVSQPCPKATEPATEAAARGNLGASSDLLRVCACIVTYLRTATYDDATSASVVVATAEAPLMLVPLRICCCCFREF